MAIRFGQRRLHLGAYFDWVRSLDARIMERLRPAKESEIRRVAAFRADRIGDAFVCLPLFLEMHRKYELSVFSSPYNDFVLRKAGLNTLVFDDPAFYREDSFSDFLRGILLFNTLFPLELLRRRMKGGTPDYDLLLLQDLSPIRRRFILEADTKARFLATPFLGHFLVPFLNVLLFRHYLVTDPGPSPVAQYDQALRTFDPSFSFVPRADALNFLAEPMEPPLDLPREGFVLFHAGGKEDRLLHDGCVVDFLNHSEVPMVVIDDDSKAALNRLKEKVKNEKVFWVLTNHSLFEYLSLLLDDRCRGYIGYDGGQSHLLSMPKSSLTLYTMGEHTKWRPYTGKPYAKREILKGIAMESSPLDGTTKAILHRDLACNPCYYRPCSDPVCRNVPLAACWEHLGPLFRP